MAPKYPKENLKTSAGISDFLIKTAFDYGYITKATVDLDDPEKGTLLEQVDKKVTAAIGELSRKR